MIVLFEPEYRGHRTSFLGYELRYLASKGEEVTLATSTEALRSEEYEMHNIPSLLESRVGIFPLGNLPRDRGKKYRRWITDQISNVYASYPRCDLYVLEGEPALTSALLFSRKHLSRTTFLVIRRPVAIGTTASSTLKSWLKASTISLLRLRGARTINLGTSTTTDRHANAGGHTVPDPVTYSHPADALEYAKRLGLGQERVWYGVFGNVGRGKNLDLILAALAETDEASRRGLLVAGRISDEERLRCQDQIHAFTARGGAVVFDNRLLPTAELDAAIASVDAAVFAQRGDSPSNIYGKACAAGTPVICSGSAILRESIRDLESGTWTPLNIKKMSRSYEQITRDSPRRKRQMCGPDEFAAALFHHIGRLDSRV